MTNVKSLLEMYVKMGGSLTDTYSDIAGGVPVGQYSTISDAVLACSKKYSAGGGGGAEKFIVTLTEENDTWTADKTVADIVAADAANQVVVAKYPYDGIYIDVPLNMAMEYQGAYVATFTGLLNAGNDNKVVCVQCANEGSGDVISVTLQDIPTSSNAPLIVTLTESSGTLTGDKTYQEVKEARMAGRPVDLVLEGYTCASVIDVSDGSSTISVTFIANGQLVTATGAPNDYVSKTL